MGTHEKNPFKKTRTLTATPATTPTSTLLIPPPPLPCRSTTLPHNQSNHVLFGSCILVPLHFLATLQLLLKGLVDLLGSAWLSLRYSFWCIVEEVGCCLERSRGRDGRLLFIAIKRQFRRAPCICFQVRQCVVFIQPWLLLARILPWQRVTRERNLQRKKYTELFFEFLVCSMP